MTSRNCWQFLAPFTPIVTLLSSKSLVMSSQNSWPLSPLLRSWLHLWTTPKNDFLCLTIIFFTNWKPIKLGSDCIRTLLLERLLNHLRLKDCSWMNTNWRMRKKTVRHKCLRSSLSLSICYTLFLLFPILRPFFLSFCFTHSSSLYGMIHSFSLILYI